jgi:hypothetical protein
MRVACGLPLRNRRDAAAPGTAAMPPDSQPDDQNDFQTGLLAVKGLIIRKLLADKRDALTELMFKHVYLAKEAPNVDRQTVWKALVSERMLLDCKSARGKGKDPKFPAIRCGVHFKDIIPFASPTTVQTFPETYNIQALSDYLHANRSRSVNVKILQEYYEALASGVLSTLRGKRGRQPKYDEHVLEDYRSRLQKLKAGEEIAERLLDNLSTPKADDQRPAKRLRKKASAASDSSQHAASQVLGSVK